MVVTFTSIGLNWYNSDVRIGYMGDSLHSMFGPLDNITFNGLLDGGSDLNYYNEVYKISIDGARLTQVQPGKILIIIITVIPKL